MRSTALAVATLIGVSQPAAAQTTILTSGGVATGAISCAPSNNGTGHMVCLEYSTSGSLIGLSWQAPPAAGGNTELVGKIDTVSLANPGGTLVGAPGCGPENNNTGTIACLVVSKTSNGSFILQGIAFYPPADIADTATPSGLVTLATEPANTVIGNPSCAAANIGGAVICAITINGELLGTGFEPKTNIFSAPGNTTTPALTPLLSSNVTGNPSCTSGEAANPSDCAIREGNALVGLAVSFTPPPSGSTVARIAAEDAVTMGSMSFAGDPSCGVPPNGQVGTTSFVATCGIVSGTTLFGLSFDPIDAIPASSPASHTTAFQSLGTAPDIGSWTGSIGCSSFSDFRGATAPDISPTQNLIGCVPISSTHNVFEVTFDPRMPVTRGMIGPFGANANANLSCLPLAIDRDNIYCGGTTTTTTGASGGYIVPVGVLSPGTAAVIVQLLSN
ncbi:MAG: hypothetical protein WCC64_16380 [Aliidongia sp.]